MRITFLNKGGFCKLFQGCNDGEEFLLHCYVICAGAQNLVLVWQHVAVTTILIKKIMFNVFPF
jgi:hypothetical protein